MPKLVRVESKAPKKPTSGGLQVALMVGGTKWKPASKPPTQPAVAADRLYTLRALRLAAQKLVDEIAEEEGVQREYLIETLPKSKAAGITGKIANATIETKSKPVVKDWTAFNAYVLKIKRPDLLQRRLNEPAIQELLDDRKVVPGVELYTTKVVSCTKK